MRSRVRNLFTPTKKAPGEDVQQLKLGVAKLESFLSSIQQFGNQLSKAIAELATIHANLGNFMLANYPDELPQKHLIPAIQHAFGVFADAKAKADLHFKSLKESLSTESTALQKFNNSAQLRETAYSKHQHYVTKLEKLQSKPGTTPKEQEKLSRNQKKLDDAAAEFHRLSEVVIHEGRRILSSQSVAISYALSKSLSASCDYFQMIGTKMATVATLAHQLESGSSRPQNLSPNMSPNISTGFQFPKQSTFQAPLTSLWTDTKLSLSSVSQWKDMTKSESAPPKSFPDNQPITSPFSNTTNNTKDDAFSTPHTTDPARLKSPVSTDTLLRQPISQPSSPHWPNAPMPKTACAAWPDASVPLHTESGGRETFDWSTTSPSTHCGVFPSRPNSLTSFPKSTVSPPWGNTASQTKFPAVTPHQISRPTSPWQ